MNVEEWFQNNRFSYKSYTSVKKLLRLKRESRKKISVIIPVLNEGKTIGKICNTIKTRLMEKNKLVDELIVIDSGSTDNTLDEAKSNGATVYSADKILKKHRHYMGKGENLWKGMYVSTGGIIVVIDGDIRNFNTRFITGLVGPLLNNKNLKYINSYFERPFVKGEVITESGGGRVTELLIRPLFNKFFPRLRGFIQPLGGAYAVRRSTLEKIPLYTGYSGDVIIPIDIQRIFGLGTMAQVDLGKIVHKHQQLSSLSNKSFGILHTILTRVNMKGKIIVLNKSNHYSVIETKKTEHKRQYDYKKKTFYEKERPPIITLMEYRKKFKIGEFKQWK